MRDLPEKFVERFKNIIPEEKFEAVLDAFSINRLVSIRINRLLTTRNNIFTLINSYKVKYEEISWYEDALIIKEAIIEEGDTLLLFDSDYEIVDNTVHIKIEEYYKKLEFTVDEYDDYRLVVNAAANFNKVVIYFKRKE